MGEGDVVRIGLLGRFRVEFGGDELAADALPSRRAADLIQLLALAEAHRLARDQVIEALWPDLDVDAGAANLRKAAHYARQGLGSPEAIVLRGGQVALFPSRTVETDVDDFEAEAAAALGSGDPEACAAAADAYDGELLPVALYEDWTQAPRERLRSRYVELLRQSAQWDRLVEAEPTDEAAYRELMRRELAAGRRPAAIRWYGRLRTALRNELGMVPSSETQTIYDECVADWGLAEPEIVGRQVELAAAAAFLSSKPSSHLGALAVRGPGGIGKTALCREVAKLATARGWTVASVTATEANVPYAPVGAAADQLVAQDRSRLDAIGERARSVLSELTPLVTAATSLEGPLTRHEAIGAFRRLLLAAGDGGPVALVIDDAHLADEATLDLLFHLGSLSGTPVLPVLAYRQEPAPDALRGGVARLARSGRVLEIDLEPLEREDAAALVAAGTHAPRTADVTDRIVELGQGNPFLTLEAARSAVAGVPALLATARSAIVARFLDLDEDATAMLGRLALAGDAVDPSGVVALSGRSEADAFALLDLALDAGVLVVAGTRYRFCHELVRQALVEEIPPHQRLGIHRDTAQRLVEAGAAPRLIARQWLAGERPDEAGDWLLAAATEAIGLGAYRDALVDLGMLLDHEPEHPDALSIQAEALDALGDATAPAAYAEAARVIGGQAAHELKAKQALAQVKRGDPPGALELLEGVEPKSVDGRVAQALAFSGCAVLGYADPAMGTNKAAEARRLAMETGDRASLVIASWAHAGAAHVRGELRDSVEADLYETHSLPELAVSVFDGQLCITQRFLYGARPYSDVIAFANSLAAEADRLGAARGRAFAVTIRGEARLLAGELDEADEDLAKGAELHRQIGAATGEAFATQRRAEVALARGDRAEAYPLLDEALDIARESDVGFHLLDRIYGARIVAAPDADAALAALEEAEAAVRGPLETCPGCRITLAVPAAIAAARGGDIERADEWESASEYLAKVVMRLPAWDAALDEVRGHRAQARGDAGEAEGRFLAAAAGFEASGQPLDANRCAELAGQVNAGSAAPSA